jgi:hypothetical protein
MIHDTNVLSSRFVNLDYSLTGLNSTFAQAYSSEGF